MNIFADKNILAVENRFSEFGDLYLFDGRSVQREDLLSADVLLVRSITTVNEALIGNTPIKFVGTATSGIDHVDTGFLEKNGILFSDARGSNANAVVDYCFAALAFAVIHKELDLATCRIGIVGAGAVGGLFAKKLSSLGIQFRCCDPPLARNDVGNGEYYPLEAILDCEVVSLHVPLLTAGDAPTANLLSHDELNRLCTKALLINTCRGGVVDEVALADLLAKRSDISTVFDVWENEPDINVGLGAQVDIATPHIAGYSQQAKMNATENLAAALAATNSSSVSAPASTAGNEVASAIRLDLNFDSELLLEHRTILEALPLEDLSDRFKASLCNGGGADAFDEMRAALLERNEFVSTETPGASYSDKQQDYLSKLGFVLS